MNSLMHAKPDSAPWYLVSLGNGWVVHAVSKILNRPNLCDELCAANHLPEHLDVRKEMMQWWADYLDANQSAYVAPYHFPQKTADKEKLVTDNTV